MKCHNFNFKKLFLKVTYFKKKIGRIYFHESVVFTIFVRTFSPEFAKIVINMIFVQINSLKFNFFL